MNVNTHAFQPCNNGLGNNLIVKGIAAKENIFKNGTLEKLVYIATNRGVYKSSDNGQNWVLIKSGNFTAIYKFETGIFNNRKRLGSGAQPLFYV